MPVICEERLTRTETWFVATCDTCFKHEDTPMYNRHEAEVAIDGTPKGWWKLVEVGGKSGNELLFCSRDCVRNYVAAAG